MDHAGHGEPVFQLRIIDAVAAHQQGPGLMNLIQAAGQDSQEHLFGHGLDGVADDVEGRQGPPAHGVHVAQGIGRGDLAERVGIVDHGGKKVHRLDQRDLGRQAIHPRVIRGLHADQQVGMGLDGQSLQNFLQNPGRNFGSSAGGSDLLHQGLVSFVGHVSSWRWLNGLSVRLALQYTSLSYFSTTGFAVSIEPSHHNAV